MSDNPPMFECRHSKCASGKKGKNYGGRCEFKSKYKRNQHEKEGRCHDCCAAGILCDTGKLWQAKNGTQPVAPKATKQGEYRCSYHPPTNKKKNSKYFACIGTNMETGRSARARKEIYLCVSFHSGYRESRVWVVDDQCTLPTLSTTGYFDYYLSMATCGNNIKQKISAIASKK